MFDKFKSVGAMAALMKNKDALREAGDRVRAKMDATRVVGEAGSGAARATVTGTLKVVSVELSPALVMGMASDNKTHQLAGSLIAEAVNNALTLAQQRLHEAISHEAKAMGLEGMIPDLGALGGLMGTGGAGGAA